MATGYRMTNPAVTPAVSAQVIEPKDSLNDSSRSSQSHSSTLYEPMVIQHTYTTSIYMSRRLAPHVTLFLLLKRVCPHTSQYLHVIWKGDWIPISHWWPCLSGRLPNSCRGRLSWNLGHWSRGNLFRVPRHLSYWTLWGLVSNFS